MLMLVQTNLEQRNVYFSLAERSERNEKSSSLLVYFARACGTGTRAVCCG